MQLRYCYVVVIEFNIYQCQVYHSRVKPTRRMCGAHSHSNEVQPKRLSECDENSAVGGLSSETSNPRLQNGL